MGPALKGRSYTGKRSLEELSMETFEHYALEYDSWFVEHPSIFESESRAIEALRLSGLGLEVGVGSGVFAKRLGVSVGIDPSLSMLLMAKRRGIEVVRAVGEYLPFRDTTFDFILMVNTLCLLVNLRPAIVDANRVLKKGGSLVLCEVPKDSSWGRLYEEKGRRGHRFYRYAKLYTIADIRRILEGAEFRVVDAKGTLTLSPGELERVEEPDSNIQGKGFVCLEALKP